MDSGSEDGMVEKTADEWKAEGNEHYKKKEYDIAISAYSVAIEISDGEVFAYYNNRAAAYLMLGKHKECVADCVKSIAIDSSAANAKAFFRKASAFKAMGKLQEVSFKSQLFRMPLYSSALYRAIVEAQGPFRL